MLRTFASCIFMICLQSFSMGQDCILQLSGYVLDRATKEPLEYSTIGISELAVGAITDSKGYFNIGALCNGSYHIQVNHLGCHPVKFFIELKNDTMITIYLEHHSELLREIVIEGKPAGNNESQSQQMISSSLIKDHAGRTLSDITGLVSGVRAIRNGSGISKPVIHGLFGNRVAVINNGLLQAGQQWGADHAPEADPNAASVITVIKGSDAIEYGSQALGGAILIDAGPINRDPHLHGSAGYAFDLNGLGHTIYGRATKSFKKTDFRLTATLKKEGDHRAPHYWLTNTGITEANSSAQFLYHVNDRIQHQLYYSLFNTTLGIFAGSHVSNLTDLRQAIGKEIPFNVDSNFSYRIEAPRQHVVHHLLKYSGKNFIEDQVFLEWSYGLQLNHRKEFDIRRGDRSDIPALDLQLWAHTVDLKYVNQNQKLHYKLGLQGRWIDNSNDYDTGILPLIPDYQKGSGALYFNSQLPLGKFIVEAGSRYDFQSSHVWAISSTLPREIVEVDHVYHDMALSIGIMSKYGVNSETRLNTAYVRRAPEVNELHSSGLHQGIAGIEEGNDQLHPENSIKMILTQSVLLHETFHFEATAYAHLIYSYIYLKPEDELRLTIRGAFPVYQYVQEDVWIRGMDFSMISDFSHRLEWSVKSSLVYGNTLDDNRSLSLIPPAYISSSLSWSVKDSKNWKGTKFRLEGEFTSHQKRWDRESELLEPPADYFLLNFQFQTGLQLKSNQFFLGMHINNLLDIQYRNYLNRLRYFADEQGRSVRVNLRYEF